MVNFDSSIRLFVGLANNDDPSTHRARECIVKAQALCPFAVTGAMVEGDGVARARNNLAAMFLASNATHLLFQDADILPEPSDYTRLVSHGLPIVGGLYSKKQARLNWVASSLDGETVNQQSGLQRVSELGTGFLCIERGVFERMIEAHPEMRYTGDPSPDAVRWDFFPMGARGGRYLSEDWSFCERARALGFDVWADWRCIVKHRGAINFPLHRTLTDDELIDLIHNRTGRAPHDIAAFIRPVMP